MVPLEKLQFPAVPPPRLPQGPGRLFHSRDLTETRLAERDSQPGGPYLNIAGLAHSP